MPTLSINHRGLLAGLLLAACLAAGTARAEDKMLCDFENDGDLKRWELKSNSGVLSDQHVTHGAKSLMIKPGEYMLCFSLPQDWTPFDSLDIDAFVEGDAPVNGSLLIADKTWDAGGKQYWDRHNGTFNLKPGANTISIPVNGLFRGEAGSRDANGRGNINPKEIIRFDIGFTTKGKVAAIYLDNMRLVKEVRPDGILAFDFGPESQTVFPGFTPISWNTVYGEKGHKAGLKASAGAPNRARDDTFPTRLYQDFVWFEENGNEFIAEVPNGKCHVWLVFDDCGYWGGETCHHRKRTISANGKEAFVDDRGEEGPADYLFRFEKIEPKPGDSLWDLYMKDLFKPARFEAEVTDGKLHIQVHADAAWSAKVAAIIIYPDSIKDSAEKWVAEIEARNKKEFDTRAVFMGPHPKPLDIPADAKEKGYWLGFPSIESTVTLVDAPGAPNAKLQRTAAKGQRLAYTFAVRPLKDFAGEAKLTGGELKGPGGTIPAAALDLRYVHHLTQRGFNDIAYTIMPMSLRRVEGAGLKLTKDFTRQFIVTLTVPADAKPGLYSGEVTLTAGELKLTVPLSVEVLNLTLDEPDFPFAFFGFWVPGELPAARRAQGEAELFALQKQMGMNSVSGGPNIHFSGFDADGKPQLDFKACDEFCKAYKQAGFSKPIYSYGGPGWVEGLHDTYQIGETGHGWEKKTGKPFKELLKIVWTAVKEHAEKEGWPTILYGQLDEPRALEPAKANLEFHKAYHEAVPFVKIGGYYSVDWKTEDATGKTVQDIFKNMAWSGLNEHSQTDLDKAKEFGTEVHIYNQDLTRYSFGAYQWAEMRKGVKGRAQWHLLALSGYQFFDLDGREPDPGVINWGRNEILPTLYCARCCEGANDFRFAVTLWNLAEKKKGTPESKAAEDFLEEVNQKIGVNKREHPEGFMDDETFRNTCIEHLKKLMGK